MFPSIFQTARALNEINNLILQFEEREAQRGYVTYPRPHS